jgi:hypothetical protein
MLAAVEFGWGACIVQGLLMSPGSLASANECVMLPLYYIAEYCIVLCCTVLYC